MKIKLKYIWNKIIIFISDVYYYIYGDRSTAYDSIKKVGRKPNWRHYARNPITGIFKKLIF